VRTLPEGGNRMKQASGKQVKVKVKANGGIGKVPAWAQESIISAYRRMAKSVTMTHFDEMKKSPALSPA
jgi:hypothetical protein